MVGHPCGAVNIAKHASLRQSAHIIHDTPSVVKCSNQVKEQFFGHEMQKFCQKTTVHCTVNEIDVYLIYHGFAVARVTDVRRLPGHKFARKRTSATIKVKSKTNLTFKGLQCCCTYCPAGHRLSHSSLPVDCRK